MKRISIVALLSMAFLTSGCANFPRGEWVGKPFPKLANIEKPVPVVGAADDEVDIELRGLVDEDLFISTPLQVSQPLPEVEIQPFSVSNATVHDVLRTILSDTDLSFSVDSEHPGANIQRRSVSATNISGPLEKVLETFSDSIGYYYYYTDGVLHVTPDRQFIAKIPPVNDLFESLPPMLKTLGATDVFIDKTSRTMTYRATKPVQEKTASYLKWVRDNKKLIVYDTYIAEVVLDDSMSTGIQWNRLSWIGEKAGISISGGSSATLSPGTIGVGAVFTGGKFAIDVLANFLKTQGTVNQISKIPMMLLSGGQTSFRNGGVDYYVSSIGAPSIASNGQVIPGQSQLSALRTGVDISLTGDIYDGTVFTNVDMSMNALTGYKTFPAGQGQSMQAPITTDRNVATTVRVRPGDTILIAGINYEKVQASISGLPGGKDAVALASDNLRSTQRSELVVVMRPKVINFKRGGQQGFSAIAPKATPVLAPESVAVPSPAPRAAAPQPAPVAAEVKVAEQETKTEPVMVKATDAKTDVAESKAEKVPDAKTWAPAEKGVLSGGASDSAQPAADQGEAE